MTEFNVDEQEALALLTLAYPAGLLYDPDYHGEACDVFEQLVESGHAIRIQSDDFQGGSATSSQSRWPRRIGS